MSKGWIKLHRELQEHWLWEGTKEFTKAQAWIDLLMEANHKSKKVIMDNELVQCNSGETITSETKLANRWGWSRTKVRSFIELLESDDMLKKHTKNKRYTKLSICNYSTYQKNGSEEKQQKNNRKTTEKQQKNINKNEKNVKNEEEINIPFADFWDAYDKKKGSKKKCRKKWQRLSDEERSLIMEHIESYKQSFSEKQYQPYPHTFLNGKNWEAESYTKDNSKKQEKIDFGI